MDGAARSRGFDPPGGGLRRAAAIAVVVFGVYTALVVTRWPNEAFVTTLTDAAFPVASLVYVPLAALAARSAQGRLRAAWLALTAAFALWAVAELLWTYYEHVAGEVPYPSWADVFYLLYVPGVAAALLLFPDIGTGRDRSRLIVDGITVTASFFLISWLTIMRSVWLERGDSHLEFALSMAYPAGDVLILALGFMVLLRVPAGLRLSVSLLVAGLACSALGNGAWSYLGEPTAYRVGGLADIFYFANIVLVILALIAAQRIEPGDGTADDTPGRLSVWLPLLPAAIAAAFVAVASRAAIMEAPVVVTGVLLVAATLVRQLMQGDDLVGRERRIRLLADQLNDELENAAHYVASILPADLRGSLSVTSRYLPSRAVGGDCFGYAWLDDDHFIVYLIDVSGHGVRPALLSVSIHNMLRSRSLSTETLLAPDRVFAELNSRFSMRNQDGHFFTMWFGVYERSTDTLRYASAGHPPPLVLAGDGGHVDTLPDGGGLPLGMVADGAFAVQNYRVDAGSQILLYSDGVMGDPPRVAELVARCAGFAARSPDWLDSFAAVLPVDDGGCYQDDCSLVLLTFG